MSKHFWIAIVCVMAIIIIGFIILLYSHQLEIYGWCPPGEHYGSQEGGALPMYNPSECRPIPPKGSL
jgi:hypothetical protein